MRVYADFGRVGLVAEVFFVFRVYNLIYAAVFAVFVVELLP